jgi:hypothetical protein
VRGWRPDLNLLSVVVFAGHRPRWVLQAGRHTDRSLGPGFLRLFLAYTNRAVPHGGRMTAEPEPQWKPIRDSSRYPL